MYSRHVSRAKVQLALVDFAAVLASMAAAAWLRYGVGVGASEAQGVEPVPWGPYLRLGLVASVLMVLLLRRQRLYAVRPRLADELVRILKAAAIVTMALLALAFFLRSPTFSRSAVAMFFPLCVLFVLGARRLFQLWMKIAVSHPSARRKVVIVGTGKVGRQLAEVLQEAPFYYQLIGFLAEEGGPPEGLAAPLLGTGDDLARVVREQAIDEVLLADPDTPARTLQRIGDCISAGVRWKAVPDFFGLMLDRVQIDAMGGVPLVGVRGSNAVGVDWVLKRGFDMAFAALALLLVSPLLLGIAAAVKLGSPGPVIFRQPRIGVGGRTFQFLKFRTMKACADDSHRAYTREWIYGRTGAPMNGLAVHKIDDDPRVTPVGRILRRTSLDELPQFWNVLRGEMSVVGPRPALSYEVERYSEWHKARLSVLPGITGLWQVSGRNAISFERMVELDVEYVERWSLALDLEIILRTVPAMLSGKGH